ncbi:hypothetical protein A2U01_0097655, partial [Trifolium medium]|nr:hypothetical protein [Trifolium medium]
KKEAVQPVVNGGGRKGKETTKRLEASFKSALVGESRGSKEEQQEKVISTKAMVEAESTTVMVLEPNLDFLPVLECSY